MVAAGSPGEVAMPPRPAFSWGPNGTNRFECVACQSTRCMRVKVKRTDGSDYETEFASCYWCGLMYHHAGRLPVFMPGGPGNFHGYQVEQPAAAAPAINKTVGPDGRS